MNRLSKLSTDCAGNWQKNLVPVSFSWPFRIFRVGGRQANASYQYTLLSDDLRALREWEPKILSTLAKLPELADVNSDQQDNGAEMNLIYDRETMLRLGISVQDANNLLNNAFGQRQISTIYEAMNQYKVVMEVDPRYTQEISALNNMFVINRDGKSIPLSRFTQWQPANAPLSVNHQGLSAASTLAFNLPTGVSLSEASDAINRTMIALGVPASVRGSFAGTAQVFQDTLNTQVILILSGYRYGLYRAGYTVRELYSSADDSLNAAFRWRWHTACTGTVWSTVQPDCVDRYYTLD